MTARGRLHNAGSVPQQARWGDGLCIERLGIEIGGDSEAARGERREIAGEGVAISAVVAYCRSHSCQTLLQPCRDVMS